MKTKIYVLCEPSGKIRYVGKTSKSLSARFSGHIRTARFGEKTHKSNWIRSLLSKGFLPNIQFVGEVDGNGATEEIAWIKYFRDEGVVLVNGTDGGEGFKAKRGACSLEHRKKIGDALRGKHHSLEARKHMGEAQRGRVFSAEHCRKISNVKKGTICSWETRQKISKIIKEWWEKRKQGG